MSNNHRVQNFYSKVTFDDFIGSKNHPVKAGRGVDDDYEEEENEYMDDEEEDDAEFLSGEDYDDAEEDISSNNFDTGTSKYKDDNPNQQSDTQNNSKPESLKKKIQVLFVGETMKLFYNPAYFDASARELLRIINKFVDSKRCIDATIEADFGIINVRFNPAIHSQDDINIVGQKVAEYIESKRRG